MAKVHKIGRGEKGNVITLDQTYTIIIDLEEIDPAYDDDEVTLKSDDDSYSQTLTIGKDGEFFEDRWVELTFTKVKPNKAYSCFHDLKRTATGQTGTLILFRGMKLDPDIGAKTYVQDEEEELQLSSGWSASFSEEEKSSQEAKEDYEKETDEKSMWLDEEKEAEGWDLPDDTDNVENELSLYETLESKD